MKLKVLALLLVLLLLFTHPAISQDTVSDLQTRINEYTQKLDELGKAKDTLSNQIKILSSQIELTRLKINQTENNIAATKVHINTLSQEIVGMDKNLNDLTAIYINQVIQNYKLNKRTPPFFTILSSNFNSFLEQYKYQRIVQGQNITLRENLEGEEIKKKQILDQKKIEEATLTELEGKLVNQNKDLSSQQTAKTKLLEVTKNDEARYQKLKTEAQSELDSLLTAVFEGSKVVKKGDPLGIMGNTGYSFGPHLHFGLYNLTKENIASFVYTSDIDASDYLSKHQWPMKDYTITQGRGRTPYSYMYSDHFHHGIDMTSPEKTIYAVDDGIAYFFKDKYPNQKAGNGNHVKLFSSDGKMTLYLHMEKFYR